MQSNHSLDETSASSAGAVAAFHRALLPGTLRNALETEFYRAHWASCATGAVGEVALRDLPTVEKEDIRAAGDTAQNRAGVVCNDILTSGTTGSPLVTVRSDKEQKFLADFFARNLSGTSESVRLRGLEFTNPYHGHLIRVPSPIHFHSVSVYDAGSFDYARSTLLKRHSDFNVDERCTVLVGLERCLRAFTYDTMLKHPSGFSGTRLRLLVSYSQYLTDAWRKRFETTWNARLVDRFGVSEIFGCAAQCLHCGWYHFEPFAIPEVIGTRSKKVLSEGKGLLALTALYPFQQAQPLVRYLTGDLVEVTHEGSCQPGTTSINPLGRARFGVPSPDGDDWLITPASVLEAVDDVAEVLRTPRFGDVGQVTDPYAIGHPKYRTSWRRVNGETRVEIEVALPTRIAPERAEEIPEVVRKDVLRRNPLLRTSVEQGRATLKVCPCDDVIPDLIAQAHFGGVWSEA